MDASEQDSHELACCLSQLAAGDLNARDRIIELSGERLRTLVHRMLGRFPTVRRWEDTDDVFQNAAMRLHRALGVLRPDSTRAVLALAATQIHRELLDLARHHTGPHSYAANHGTNVMPRAAGDTAGSYFIDQRPAEEPNLERWTLFQEAIDALPVEQREVFHLVWYLGADQRTIARLLGCSERTVKYRWRSAREAVRASLDGEPPQR